MTNYISLATARKQALEIDEHLRVKGTKRGLCIVYEPLLYNKIPYGVARSWSEALASARKTKEYLEVAKKEREKNSESVGMDKKVETEVNKE